MEIRRRYTWKVLEIHPFKEGPLLHRTFHLVPLFLAFGTGAPSFASDPGNGGNYLGINVSFLNTSDETNAFADVALHSRRWQSGANWKDSVAIDEDGWPLGDASTVLFGKGNQPGRYQLQFEGQAQSVKVMWIAGRVDSLVWDPATNTSKASVVITAPVTSSGGLILMGTKRTEDSPTGSGFRNLHLWRPGVPVDGSRIFTDSWESLIRRFHVVRFMDWGYTNRNPLVSWKDRRKPMDASRGDVVIDGRPGAVGMPLELMVALCNRTGADAWINVPPMADSMYVVNLVKAVLNGTDGKDPYDSPVARPVWEPLRPGLVMYLEYGNELWNSAGGFQNFRWLHTQSEELRAGSRTEPIFFDGIDEEWVTLFRWMGWRAAQVSLWARSVAGQEMMGRVRPVLMGQNGYHAMSGNILRFLETWYASPRQGRTKTLRIKDLFWGSGGAIYATSVGTTAESFFEAGSYPKPGWIAGTAADVLQAKAYGLHPIAYEGGPALDELDEPTKDSVFADSRMQGLLEGHHELWSRLGGGLAVYYSASYARNWRFTSSWDDSLSPKMRAIDALRGRPSLVSEQGCTAPCVLQADTLVKGVGSGTFWTNKGAKWGFVPGAWQSYPVSIPHDGTWSLTLKAHSLNKTDSVDILLADSLVATRAVGDVSDFSDLMPVRLSLKSGLNVVRIRGRTGRTDLASLRWEEVAPTAVDGSRSKQQRRRLLLRGPGGGISSIRIPLDATSLTVYGMDGRVLSRQELDSHLGDKPLEVRVQGAGMIRTDSPTERNWVRFVSF